MTKNLIAPFLLAIAGVLPASQSAAQSLAAPGQSDDGWRHAAGIYMFAPLRTHGTSTVAGNSLPLDLSLSQVLDNLDFAAAGRYEAWNGDFGIIVDGNYAGLDANGNLPGPGGAAFRIKSRQKWLGILGAYRVAHGTTRMANLFP